MIDGASGKMTSRYESDNSANRRISTTSDRFDVYVESGRKALQQLDNYREIGRRVKGMVNVVWKDANVYIFGSVIDGKYTAMSDIDMLIVVEGVSREDTYRVKAMIHKAIDAPIELHIASKEEFNHWYKRFTNKFEEIV